MCTRVIKEFRSNVGINKTTQELNSCCFKILCYLCRHLCATTGPYADEGTLDAGAWPSGYTSGDTSVHTTKNLRACGMEISLLPKSTTLQQISSKDYQTLFFRIAGVAGTPKNCYFSLETLSSIQGLRQTQPRGQTLNLLSLM